ncbi:MAG TPA: NUDIX domain-containing protein [Candidatus Paceibacterota bacterium]|nr:NUDIX domain-containing protein [Candidatus Paceibacterota bacterium]HMP18911.1 NUDIX domain-containing protein [Candidatus Paceibacterota bacterium]HMP85072.1 NUDIX domain-containing protein [Candidatus Paceibacterota bacterium]
MQFLHWLRKFLIYKILKRKTFGVRVAIFDQNKILLVRHRYNDFWVFPGGGIKNKELKNQNLIEESAIREIQEEVLIEIKKPLIKFSEYKNTTGGKNDTVILFVAKKWKFLDNKKQSILDKIEILESKWFDIKDLPTSISVATKNRIFEIISYYQDQNFQISHDW